MSDRTHHLSLPFILPSQAQKHVTHNEALLALDTIVQLVISAKEVTPPIAPDTGVCFAVNGSVSGDGASGDWVGQEGKIATWQDEAWQFIEPVDGWIAWFSADARLRVFRLGDWHDLTPTDASLSSLGINTTADKLDRLAVASGASLFTHAGNGHQMKINKASAADTASLLFQSGWTGHAEIGLAGENGLSLKVSDGVDWKTGLAIGQDGMVTLPHRPAGRAYQAYGSGSVAANTRTGFETIQPVQGNITLGTVLPDGSHTVLIPADGLYLMSLLVTMITSAIHNVSLVRNGTTEIMFALSLPPAPLVSLSHSQVALLSAGDELCLLHSGTAELYTGPGITELSLLRI